MDGKIHHDNAVFLHQPHQHNNSHKAEKIQFLPEDPEGEQGTKTCQWQCREDGKGMDKIFIENGEDGIDQGNGGQ